MEEQLNTPEEQKTEESKPSEMESNTSIENETEKALENKPETIEIQNAEAMATEPETSVEEKPVEKKKRISSKVDKPIEAIAETAKTETEEVPEIKSEDPHTFVSKNIDKLIRLKDELNFTDFWFYVKELNTLIFNQKGLAKEDRAKFKEHISELCDDAKKLQDEVKAKVAKTSKLKLEQVEQMIQTALAHGDSHEDMEKSFLEIDAANKFLREGIVKAETGEESADMSRNDREKAKDLIKNAREAIFDKKRGLREGNFKTVIDKLNHIADKALNENPRGAFNAIKNLRTEMKAMTMDRGQFKEINDLIDTIWKKAIQKIENGRVYDQKKKTSELDISLKRKTEFIEKLEQEVRDLNAKLGNVRGNDFFSNRMKEQIEEKKEKIENTKKEIESVKEKIVFMKQKEELK